MSDNEDQSAQAARWERMQVIFHEAAELSGEPRDAFLRKACGPDEELREHVLAMLAVDAEGQGILEGGLAAAAEGVLAPSAPPIPQMAFGPYRLTGILGEGGMGVVYRAHRTDLSSDAAIKILRDAALSPSRRERFAFEQRALAKLNHPSIARLYEADVLPDGTPWFAMELVEGIPLTEYCAAHELSIEARLKLFREVCQAVQHAHESTILHRDLKASNILVRADGRVKLLDFGISKSLESLDNLADATRTGMRMMTPAYAAPEQVRGGPMGVYTDVYSLGVVLYELLTGRLPFDLSGRTPSEAATILTETTVRRPSTATTVNVPHRPGHAAWQDLDVLCMTAMHRDPERRYRTVGALLLELDRYLANEPLLARGDSVRYRAGKFLRRNRTMVTAVSLAVGVLATVVMLYTVRLTESRNASKVAATRATRIQEFTTNMLQGGDDEAGPSDTLRVITLIDRGAARVPEFQSEPAVQADFERTLGGMYQALGRLDRADSLLSSAYSHTLQLAPAPPADLVSSLMALALLRATQERHADAESLARQALSVATRRLTASDPLITEANDMLGTVLWMGGHDASAVPYLLEAIRRYSGPSGSEPKLSVAQTTLANAYDDLGRSAEADSLYRLGLARDRRILGNHHPNVAVDLINIGDVLSDRGNYAKAEASYREALHIMSEWYGKNHFNTANCLTKLASALVSQNRLDEAEPLLREALRIHEAIFGPMHSKIALILNSMAEIALGKGDYQESIALWTRALNIYRSVYGAHHVSVGSILGNLGTAFLERGQYPSAESYFRSALEADRGALPPGHKAIAILRIKLGRSLLGQRRYAQGEKETRSGYEALLPQMEPGASYLRAARRDLIKDYMALGRPKDAAPFIAEIADTASGR